MEVFQSNAVREVLHAARKRQIVVGTEAHAVDLILPVGILCAQQRNLIGRSIRVDRVAELVARHDRDRSDPRRNGVVRAEAHAKLVGALSPLRGDQDHAVGGARSVDRRGRRILEHGDVLDVVGVDQAERVARAGDASVVNRHTVDDDERIVARVERGAAADPDAAPRAGHAAAVGDLHPGDLARHELLGRRDVPGQKIIGINRRHRSRQVAGLGRAVADHDRLVEQEGLLFHLHVDDHRARARCTHVLCPGSEADVAELDDVLAGVQRQRILSIEIRHGSVRGSRDDDVDPDQGLSRFRIGDRARDRGLGGTDQRNEQQQPDDQSRNIHGSMEFACERFCAVSQFRCEETTP